MPRLRPVENIEAILGYTRGKVLSLKQSCDDCKNRTKSFTSCIILDDLFQGSCTACHDNSLGIKCSLRSGRYFIPYDLVSTNF